MQVRVEKGQSPKLQALAKINRRSAAAENNAALAHWFTVAPNPALLADVLVGRLLRKK